MGDKISACEISLIPEDNRRLMDLCGRFDEHLRQIEKRLGVEINNRGNQFQILGERNAVHLTHELLNQLYAHTAKGQLSPSTVHLFLQSLTRTSDPHSNSSFTEPAVIHPQHTQAGLKIPKARIKPYSKNQEIYMNQILAHDVNFGVGPAGTGKTFLAVACAVAALESEQVKRIVLVRPAVEAGERLGFLPGDLSQKIDPYLRPLYDALYEMLGFEKVAKLMERNVIELAPLAYMRGRTLNDAFIILDEAQNTTREQMKMFLTRLGFGSTAVITGDITQVDLPRGIASGLKQAIHILKDIPGVSFTFFASKDIVRHPLVQHIVDAYDNNESDTPPSKEDR